MEVYRGPGVIEKLVGKIAEATVSGLSRMVSVG